MSLIWIEIFEYIQIYISLIGFKAIKKFLSFDSEVVEEFHFNPS